MNPMNPPLACKGAKVRNTKVRNTKVRNAKVRNAKVRNIVFCFLSALGVALFPAVAHAATHVRAQIQTGSDDLRGGNTAFITLILMDGRVLPERVLSTGMGGGTRSISRITFPETFTTNDIRSIRIRHDGNARSGHPFDEYDQWHLSGLRIDLVDSSFRSLSSQPLYDSQRDSTFFNRRIIRFDRWKRQVELPIRPMNSEPDLIISYIQPISPSELHVTVRNVGLGPGRLTAIACASRRGERWQSFVDPPVVRSDRDRYIRVNWPDWSAAGRTTCSLYGNDERDYEEAVKANNTFSFTF